MGESSSKQVAQFWSWYHLKEHKGNIFPLKNPAGLQMPQKGHREMPSGRDSHVGRCFAAQVALLQG